MSAADQQKITTHFVQVISGRYIGSSGWTLQSRIKIWYMDHRGEYSEPIIVLLPGGRQVYCAIDEVVIVRTVSFMPRPRYTGPMGVTSNLEIEHVCDS